MAEKAKSKASAASGSASPVPPSPRKKQLQASSSAVTEKVDKAELGWISSTIKSTSHNRHLNKLQKASAAALKVFGFYNSYISMLYLCACFIYVHLFIFVCLLVYMLILLKSAWEPPRLKAKAQEEREKARILGLSRQAVAPPTASRDQSGFGYHEEAGGGLSFQDLASSPDDSMAPGGVSESKEDDSVEAIFGRFKSKLNVLNSRWLQAKKLPSKDRVMKLTSLIIRSHL